MNLPTTSYLIFNIYWNGCQPSLEDLNLFFWHQNKFISKWKKKGKTVILEKLCQPFWSLIGFQWFCCNARRLVYGDCFAFVLFHHKNILVTRWLAQTKYLVEYFHGQLIWLIIAKQNLLTEIMKQTNASVHACSRLARKFLAQIFFL